MGGSLDVSVGENRTDIGGDVLTEFGPQMIALVADVARNPKLPESELARLKADRARQLSVAKSQPQPLAQEKLRAVLYGDIAVRAHLPDRGDALGLHDRPGQGLLRRATSARPAPTSTSSAASTPPAVEAAARKAFSDWKPGAAPAPPAAAAKSARAVYLLDRPGAPQSTINIAMPVIDPSQPDWDRLFLMNVLLGGSFSSRITSNIREQKGYTYSPQGQLSSRYRDAYWVEIADVTTDKTGPAIKEILGEIDRLQAEPPSEKELKAFQNYRAGIFVLQNSSRGGIVGQLEFVDLHGLPADYLNGYVRPRLRHDAGSRCSRWRRSTSRTTRPRSSSWATRRSSRTRSRSSGR